MLTCLKQLVKFLLLLVPRICVVCDKFLGLGECLGNSPDHHSTDAREQKGCAVMCAASSAELLEYRQFQWGHGDNSRT